MIFNILFILLLTGKCLSLHDTEEEKAENLLPRLLRGGFWTFVERIQGGYMMPYPRIGRHLFDNDPQTMIPSDRIGRKIGDRIQSEFVLELNQFLEDSADNSLFKSLVDNDNRNIMHEDYQYRINSPFVVDINDGLNNHDVMGFRNSINQDEFSSDAITSIASSTNARTSNTNGYKVYVENDGPLRGHSKLLDLDKISVDSDGMEDKVQSKDMSDRGNFKYYVTRFGDDKEKKDVGESTAKTLEENGLDQYSESKRQGLIPLPRFGRWALVEEKKQSGGMMPYPRLGRRHLVLETVIPYPRAGRDLTDLDDPFYAYEYEMLPTFDEWVLAPSVGSLDNGPAIKKRAQIAFTPRIGRKKRSIPEEESHQEIDQQGTEAQKSNTHLMNKPFDFATWMRIADGNADDSDEDDMFIRPRRQQYRSRNAFVPRVGKKSMFEQDFDDVNGNKRAVAFTPRIGRAALIPRIGRNDNRLMSRAAFIPRIGRSTAYGEQHASKSTNEQLQTQ